MKKFISILIISLVASAAYAADFYFSWKANPTSEMVTSYVIEQAKPPSTNFVAVVTVTSGTNGVVRGLTAGVYKFRLVAKNGVGSSQPSAEVSYPTNSPSQPFEFKLDSVK